MPNLTCPHCNGLLELEVSVDLKSRPPRDEPSVRHASLYDEAGHVNVAAKRAVGALLLQTGDGRFTFAELSAVYDLDFIPDGAPSLRPSDLARVFKMLGARPYRTSTTRGYEVDTSTVRAKLEAMAGEPAGAALLGADEAEQDSAESKE